MRPGTPPGGTLGGGRVVAVSHEERDASARDCGHGEEKRPAADDQGGAARPLVFSGVSCASDSADSSSPLRVLLQYQAVTE